MEDKAINCPKDNCNGILVEGVRGFYKCTVCGAKVKKSLVAQLSNGGTTVANTGGSKRGVVAVDKKVVATTNKATEEPKGAPQPIVADAPEVSINKEQAAPAAPKQPTQKVKTEDGITLVGKTTVIKCIDCGAERMIKVQDVFQVKRCVKCQKEYTKRRRAEKLKASRAESATKQA